MKKLSIALLLSAALAAPAMAAAPSSGKDNPKCEPNPVFSPFPGSSMSSCERSNFSELKLRRWKNPDNPRAGVEYFKVEGEYWYYHGSIEKNAAGGKPGKLEVQRNYETAVLEAKGKILSVDDGAGRVTYQIRKGDQEYWGESGCGGTSGMVCNSINHKIVRVAGMQQSVVVSAEQIAKAMGEEGKVVFYGIYFDTDKATLKAESGPTLVEMAKWLNTNAAAKVYIVGHTDMQGAAAHNQTLSRNRAAAVVDALVKQHGIKPDRLGAEGVGPYAPVAGNDSEAGRAKNRRVEMVLR